MVFPRLYLRRTLAELIKAGTETAAVKKFYDFVLFHPFLALGGSAKFLFLPPRFSGKGDFLKYHR